jgi:hypothetical protein
MNKVPSRSHEVQDSKHLITVLVEIICQKILNSPNRANARKILRHLAATSDTPKGYKEISKATKIKDRKGDPYRNIRQILNGLIELTEHYGEIYGVKIIKTTLPKEDGVGGAPKVAFQIQLTNPEAIDLLDEKDLKILAALESRLGEELMYDEISRLAGLGQSRRDLITIRRKVQRLATMSHITGIHIDIDQIEYYYRNIKPYVITASRLTAEDLESNNDFPVTTAEGMTQNPIKVITPINKTQEDILKKTQRTLRMQNVVPRPLSGAEFAVHEEHIRNLLANGSWVFWREHPRFKAMQYILDKCIEEEGACTIRGFELRTKFGPTGDSQFATRFADLTQAKALELGIGLMSLERDVFCPFVLDPDERELAVLATYECNGETCYLDHSLPFNRNTIYSRIFPGNGRKPTRERIKPLSERQIRILAKTTQGMEMTIKGHRQKPVKTKELAEKIGCSQDTIKRDLADMSKKREQTSVYARLRTDSCVEPVALDLKWLK